MSHIQHSASRKTSLLITAKKIEFVFRISPMYLILAAIGFHLALTMTVYLVGRFGLLPGVFDTNGTFGNDAMLFRGEAASLAEILTRGSVSEWLSTPSPFFHVRLHSLSFAALGPWSGFTILAAEPLNILCYLATLILVFKLGEEVLDRRVGILAAISVALWPSFLLHTTQPLRDPLFVPTMLALVFTVSSLLTGSYSWRRGLIIGATGVVVGVVLWIVRPAIWLLVLAALFFGASLLVLRQLLEKRILELPPIGWQLFILGNSQSD